MGVLPEVGVTSNFSQALRSHILWRPPSCFLTTPLVSTSVHSVYMYSLHSAYNRGLGQSDKGCYSLCLLCHLSTDQSHVNNIDQRFLQSLNQRYLFTVGPFIEALLTFTARIQNSLFFTLPLRLGGLLVCHCRWY